MDPWTIYAARTDPATWHECSAARIISTVQCSSCRENNIFICVHVRKHKIFYDGSVMNSEAQCTLFKLCQDTGTITLVADSEAGPRGIGTNQTSLPVVSLPLSYLPFYQITNSHILSFWNCMIIKVTVAILPKPKCRNLIQSLLFWVTSRHMVLSILLEWKTCRPHRQETWEWDARRSFHLPIKMSAEIMW